MGDTIHTSRPTPVDADGRNYFSSSSSSSSFLTTSSGSSAGGGSGAPWRAAMGAPTCSANSSTAAPGAAWGKTDATALNRTGSLPTSPVRSHVFSRSSWTLSTVSSRWRWRSQRASSSSAASRAFFLMRNRAGQERYNGQYASRVHPRPPGVATAPSRLATRGTCGGGGGGGNDKERTARQRVSPALLLLVGGVGFGLDPLLEPGHRGRALAIRSWDGR